MTASRDPLPDTWGAITVGRATPDGGVANSAWHVGRNFADRIAALCEAEFGTPQLQNVFAPHELGLSDETLARLEMPLVVGEVQP